MDSGHFLDAGLAPCCPETEDDGLAVIGDTGGIEWIAFDVLDINGRNFSVLGNGSLRKHAGRKKDQGG